MWAVKILVRALGVGVLLAVLMLPSSSDASLRVQPSTARRSVCIVGLDAVQPGQRFSKELSRICVSSEAAAIAILTKGAIQVPDGPAAASMLDYLTKWGYVPTVGKNFEHVDFGGSQIIYLNSIGCVCGREFVVNDLGYYGWAKKISSALPTIRCRTITHYGVTYPGSKTWGYSCRNREGCPRLPWQLNDWTKAVRLS